MKLQSQLLTAQSAFNQDVQDPLINRAEENDLYILAAILLILILLAVGLLNRGVENMVLFALFLSTILIFLVMALFA